MSDKFFNLSAKRIIVSTVGIPDAMRDWVALYPEVTLAVSLHSAEADVRKRLIPLARTHSLKQISRAIQESGEHLARPKA